MGGLLHRNPAQWASGCQSSETTPSDNEFLTSRFQRIRALRTAGERGKS